MLQFPINVWFVIIGQYLGRDTTIWESEGAKIKNLNIEKIAFKVVQIKFLAEYHSFVKHKISYFEKKL